MFSCVYLLLMVWPAVLDSLAVWPLMARRAVRKDWCSSIMSLRASMRGLSLGHLSWSCGFSLYCLARLVIMLSVMLIMSTVRSIWYRSLYLRNDRLMSRVTMFLLVSVALGSYHVCSACTGSSVG